MAVDMWMYLDAASNGKRGPLPEDLMKRLVRKGVLQPDQYVWTQRLKEWVPIATVEPFKAYIDVWTSYWYYLVEQERKGPVNTKDLVALFLDGEIDGLTVVWTSSMTEWKPISEVPSLKEFLHEANEDQEREEKLTKSRVKVAAEDQVYQDRCGPLPFLSLCLV